MILCKHCGREIRRDYAGVWCDADPVGLALMLVFCESQDDSDATDQRHEPAEVSA